LRKTITLVLHLLVVVEPALFESPMAGFVFLEMADLGVNFGEQLRITQSISLI
jgi:hypothetical protein